MQEDSELKLKRSSVTSFLVAMLILSTVVSVLVASNNSSLKSIIINPTRENTLAQYQTSEPLLIESDADFALLGATGDGTLSDPFTFENLQISNTSSCILVSDTTAYFVISNCKLESVNAFPVIQFDNVENGQVEQCEVAGVAAGVDIMASSDCSVVESTFIACWDALMLRQSTRLLVFGNTIRSNQRGILFQQSNHCDILNNTIYANFDLGLQIDINSYNNTVLENSIGWNNRNAFDAGVNNTFDDGSSIGNSWSDFNESETYQILGNGGSIDAYGQIWVDNVIPQVIPLSDIAIDVETVDNELTWVVYDQYLVSYEVQELEMTTTSGIWIEGDITYGLDHLRVGTHSITLLLYDAAGNEASDEILVTVMSFLLGGIGTELVMIASGITVACFVVIILLIKRLS